MLITFLHLHQGIKESRYRRVDARMGGEATKVDAALFFFNGVTLSWDDIAVVIECKLQKQKRQSTARSQLKRAAELVFSNQFRLFLWGISVFSHQDKDDQMKYKYELHLYTRSGVFYSKEHDLDTEFQQFCDLLVGFSKMTPTQHGWYLVPDPAPGFELPKTAPKSSVGLLPLQISTYTTETLHLSHVLSARPGIDNRATLVVLGLNPKGKPRVVKLTWLSPHRAERYERVLQHIKGTPIPGVPNVLYSGFLRQSEDAKREDQYSVHELVRLVAGTSADALLNRDDFPNRQLFCVITDQPGVLIENESSLERVFNACADVVQREHVLYSHPDFALKLQIM